MVCIISRQRELERTHIHKCGCIEVIITIMNILSVGLSFSLVCCLSGFKEENIFLDKEFVHLEALPLDKLLKINQELRKKGKYIFIEIRNIFIGVPNISNYSNCEIISEHLILLRKKTFRIRVMLMYSIFIIL